MAIEPNLLDYAATKKGQSAIENDQARRTEEKPVYGRCIAGFENNRLPGDAYPGPNQNESDYGEDQPSLAEPPEIDGVDPTGTSCVLLFRHRV